jgi:membrane protease YdiL (CAAX protease family)
MPAVGLLTDRLGIDGEDFRTDLLVSDASKWAVFLLLCGFVVFVEGRPLSSLSGRSLDPLSFVAAVGGGVILLFAASAAATPLFERFGIGGVSDEMTRFGSLSVPHRLGVAATAGITEEALFHGYAIERLLEATGSPLIAGGVSFVAFTFGHVVGWDRDSVVRIAVPALVTTLLYLLIRDVVALMAIHAVNDAVGLLLVGSFESESEANESETATEKSTQ